MTTFNDLPAPALHLITRFARTRHIRGTNRYARVCRSWRDASNDSEGQEQLQLLLALEGLPADTISSTSEWLVQHGVCVNTLQVTYDLDAAPLFQQLPLSTAPLVGLVRLEVDGPDSLVALGPALPQLVALTHLEASVGLMATGSRIEDWSPGVLSARGVPLEEVPCLQQLCPGLKTLHLNIDQQGAVSNGLIGRVDAPVAQVLPVGLERLNLHSTYTSTSTGVLCATLAPCSSLRAICMACIGVVDPDELLLMEGLQEVDLQSCEYWVNGTWMMVLQWLTEGLCTAPQHMTKLTGLDLWDCPAPQPVLERAPKLRRLNVAVDGPDAAARVQQLSVLSTLRHLDLVPNLSQHSDVAALVLAVSCLQQLTCLGLYTAKEVPRSTWAGLFPCLTQLRVLTVDRDQLLVGALAEEVSQLVQLQCLCLSDCQEPRWDPAAACAGVSPFLDKLSQCSTLTDVLYTAFEANEPTPAQPRLEYVNQGMLHLSCWHKWYYTGEGEQVVRPRPCLHLSGVWELQQEPADELCSE